MIAIGRGSSCVALKKDRTMSHPSQLPPITWRTASNRPAAADICRGCYCRRGFRPQTSTTLCRQPAVAAMRSASSGGTTRSCRPMMTRSGHLTFCMKLSRLNCSSAVRASASSRTFNRATNASRVRSGALSKCGAMEHHPASEIVALTRGSNAAARVAKYPPRLTPSKPRWSAATSAELPDSRWRSARAPRSRNATGARTPSPLPWPVYSQNRHAAPQEVVTVRM